MIKELEQSTINGFYTKLKIQSTSADEFQAQINALKKDEEKEKKTKLSNSDLDLSKTLNDFVPYAQNKLYQDTLKKAQDEELKKLFALIDKNNQAR